MQYQKVNSLLFMYKLLCFNLITTHPYFFQNSKHLTFSLTMGSRYLVTIISGTDEGYSIAIRGNSIVITLRDPRDHFQVSKYLFHHSFIRTGKNS
jgi:hypothetical protein